MVRGLGFCFISIVNGVKNVCILESYCLLRFIFSYSEWKGKGRLCVFGFGIFFWYVFDFLFFSLLEFFLGFF